MPADLDKLQGTWTVTSLEIDGQPFSASALKSQIVIKKNKFKSIAMGAEYEGIVELEETKKPKTFDLIFTAGPEKGNRNPGIYKLDGDEWTICLATRGGKRPRKFSSRGGEGWALQTLTRGTVAAVYDRRESEPEVVPGNRTELEGDWDMIEAVFNGAPMSEDMMKWCTRTTRGNITTVMAGPQTMLKASFTLDASKPSAIDYVNLSGTANGKSQFGIYALNGDTLKICMAAPGKPRPAGFESKRGDGRSYTAWRKKR